MCKPVITYTINLCECHEGSFRGKHKDFYERDSEGWIRCSDCGNVPDEIGTPTDPRHRVELAVVNTIDSELTERYKVILQGRENDA